MKMLISNILAHIRGGWNGLSSTLIERFILSLPSAILRNILVRFFGVKASRNVLFYAAFTIRNPKGLVIEDRVNIGHREDKNYQYGCQYKNDFSHFY